MSYYQQLEYLYAEVSHNNKNQCCSISIYCGQGISILINTKHFMSTFWENLQVPLLFQHVAIRLIDCMYRHMYAAIDQAISVVSEWHHCYIFHQSYISNQREIFIILHKEEKCQAEKVTNVIERGIIAQYHYRLNVCIQLCIIWASKNHT